MAPERGPHPYERALRSATDAVSLSGKTGDRGLQATARYWRASLLGAAPASERGRREREREREPEKTQRRTREGGEVDRVCETKTETNREGAQNIYRSTDG